MTISYPGDQHCVQYATVRFRTDGPSAPHSPLLRRRARNELPEMEAVASRHATRYAVVPLLRDEPVGVDRLLELAGRVSEPA